MTKASDDKAQQGGASTGATGPTDEELMLFVDGELEGTRLDEVALFAQRDATARRKVTALRLAGSLLRDAAIGPTVARSADGIADAVMAKIESNGAAKVLPLRPGSDAAAKDAASAKPANDNARRIFAFAAVAMAAAAAFMVWGRSSDAPSLQQAPVAAIEAPDPAVPAMPAKPIDTASEVALAAPESDAPGVEVAAIDFGARTGTIFYVPSEATKNATTTAVVWINDDGAGGL